MKKFGSGILDRKMFGSGKTALSVYSCVKKYIFAELTSTMAGTDNEMGLLPKGKRFTTDEWCEVALCGW
jgi:hypothetical protein